MDDSIRKAARALIIAHEGFRDRPYRDSMGFLTIGYGHCLDSHPITQVAAGHILDDDLDWFVTALHRNVPGFDGFEPARQAVLIDMAFNLGLIGIMKFHGMWKAIMAGNWEAAANEMMDSSWAVQVGQRALEDARIMRTGKI